MGKQKRPVLEGEDDGEGHSWKVLKANGGAVDVYYGCLLYTSDAADE